MWAYRWTEPTSMITGQDVMDLVDSTGYGAWAKNRLVAHSDLRCVGGSEGSGEPSAGDDDL